MSTFQKIHEITLELYQHLQLPFPRDNRDEYIEKINRMLYTREELIELASQHINDDDKVFNNDIIIYNGKIKELMKKYLRIIQSDIINTKKKKETGVRYENPYDSISIDGMFFDKMN